MNQGKYIVIEGLEGCGKGTQVARLVEYLSPRIISVREPGSTPVAEAIRTILKSPGIAKTPRTNLYLFVAARVDLADSIIRPALQSGRTVVGDRNWLSSLAYQGSEAVEIEEIVKLNQLALGDLYVPDLMILIDADPLRCIERLRQRSGDEADRFDYFGVEAFDKLQAARQAYLREVKRFANHVIVDGNLTVEEVWQLIKQAVDAR